MHADPHLNDWVVAVNNDNLIDVNISQDFEIGEAYVVLKDSSRCLVMKQKVVSNNFQIEIPTGEPIFMELVSPKGVSVRYVDGSGKVFYDKLIVN